MFKPPQKRATPSEPTRVSFCTYFASNKCSICFTNFHLFAEILSLKKARARALLLATRSGSVVQWLGFSTCTAAAWFDSQSGNRDPASSRSTLWPPQVKDRQRLGWGGLTVACTHHRCTLNEVKASKQNPAAPGFPHPLSAPLSGRHCDTEVQHRS